MRVGMERGNVGRAEAVMVYLVHRLINPRGWLLQEPHGSRLMFCVDGLSACATSGAWWSERNYFIKANRFYRSLA